jgi:hypothetical protein
MVRVSRISHRDRHTHKKVGGSVFHRYFSLREGRAENHRPCMQHHGLPQLPRRSFRVSSRSFYTQVIPGRGAWPDLPVSVSVRRMWRTSNPIHNIHFVVFAHQGVS